MLKMQSAENSQELKVNCKGMNESAMILSVFENRLTAGLVLTQHADKSSC